MYKNIATTLKEYLNENNAFNKIWYHGSDYKFDSFENRQSNGVSALGIFFTDDKLLAEIFGSNIYQINANYLKPYSMSMDKWDDIRLSHAKDTVYFQNMREELINKGYDSIFIKERILKFGGNMLRDGNILILFDKSQINMIK